MTNFAPVNGGSSNKSGDPPANAPRSGSEERATTQTTGQQTQTQTQATTARQQQPGSPHRRTSQSQGPMAPYERRTPPLQRDGWTPANAEPQHNRLAPRQPSAESPGRKRSLSTEAPPSANPRSYQEQTDWLVQQAQQAERECERDQESESPDDDDRDASRPDDMSPLSSGKRDFAGAFGSQAPDDHDERRDSGSGPAAQGDAKKRKRNFSNRTKTGCLTCRRRKKKCDEHKPECSNCLRGGFLCQGYPPQRAAAGWQKPDKGAAIPLESKDPSYVPSYGGILSHPPQTAPPPTTPTAAVAHVSQSQQLPPPPPQQQHPVASHHPPIRREPLPPYRGGPTLRIDTPQSRPTRTDDDRPTASTTLSAMATSPDMKLSALSAYTHNTSVFPTPISAVSHHHHHQPPFSKDYSRVPPLHDPSRAADPDSLHPSEATTTTALPRINVLNPSGSTSSPIVHTTSAHPAMEPISAMSERPSSAVSGAMDPRLFPDPVRSRPRVSPNKEKMRRGQLFAALDPELRWEKERCAAAVLRFNNAMTPLNGVSHHERSRLFSEIIVPHLAPHVVASPLSHGHVGERVTVDAPFHCDYGYNLRIGHNVVIERNCSIGDSTEVAIGDYTRIGPNVRIYTTTVPEDPAKRRDPACLTIARPVVIEENCYIEPDVIILPGVTIGEGSIVRAGSIVSTNVPPSTVVAGSPAVVLRGVNTQADEAR